MSYLVESHECERTFLGGVGWSWSSLAPMLMHNSAASSKALTHRHTKGSVGSVAGSDASHSDIRCCSNYGAESISAREN
jgi:hypothetical protein